MSVSMPPTSATSGTDEDVALISGRPEAADKGASPAATFVFAQKYASPAPSRPTKLARGSGGVRRDQRPGGGVGAAPKGICGAFRVILRREPRFGGLEDENSASVPILRGSQRLAPQDDGRACVASVTVYHGCNVTPSCP